jgi:hypothetical protein
MHDQLLGQKKPTHASAQNRLLFYWAPDGECKSAQENKWDELALSREMFVVWADRGYGRMEEGLRKTRRTPQPMSRPLQWERKQSAGLAEISCRPLRLEGMTVVRLQ